MQLTVRMDEDVVQQLDKIAEDLSRPGLPLTRADAVRVAIVTGIERLAEISKVKTAPPRVTDLDQARAKKRSTPKPSK